MESEHNQYNFEKTWQMFQEISKKFQENQEEMRRMSEETDKKFQETDRQFKETDKKFQETDKKFQESRKEMERMSKATDKKINKVAGIFATQWGKLMEALITPSCLKLFKDRNIDVTRVFNNVAIKREDDEAEFDIVLANGSEVVIIEVKTDMTVDKVNHFLKNLEKIKDYFPEYKDKVIYGAVAAIKYSESSERYAYRKGLFVMRNSGDNIIEIANNKDFVPVAFGE